MESKQRKSTRTDSREKKRFNQKSLTHLKTFQIFYNQEKLLKIEIENNKTIKDLNKLLKQKLKDRFYNFLGLQSLSKSQVLDYMLMTKNCSLSGINQNQKFKILLEGQVQDLHMPTLNDFFFLKYLGKGASSVVYLVRHKQNCKLYALKQVEKTYITDFIKMEFLLRQKKILTEIVNKSHFVSKTYATFQSRDHLNFLLKYYPGGELFYHLQDHRLKQNEAKLYFCQVLLALQSLHQQKIIFRDLKPENILIDLNGNASLSDFGLCKTNVKKSELTTSYCGSDVYMAPQMKEKMGYNFHVDFYTLGALLFQMITGLPPFYNNQVLKFPQNLSKQVIQLCKKLLQHDLNKRLCDIQQIKRHDWLGNIDWQKIKKKQYQMPIKLNPKKSYIHEDFRESLTFQQIQEPIFDRLFDFFFWISDNENGISQCYHLKKQKKKQEIPNQKDFLKKQKDKSHSKSHQNSSDKYKKFFNKFNQPYRKNENGQKKQKSSSKNQTLGKQRQKSIKRKSFQNSPFIHKQKDDKSQNKQKSSEKNSGLNRFNSSNNQNQVNIYQQNTPKMRRPEIKSFKSAKNLVKINFDSTAVNKLPLSPKILKKNNEKSQRL